MGINWWDEWNIGDDTIGQRYGATIKKYDLMNKLLHSLKNDPFGRRHVINMYQYDDLYTSPGLHPCAYETLWSVRKVGFEYFLDMTLTQRSSDYIVAGYINKTQYLALQMKVAGHLGYKVGKFCHLVQNLHIYDRHIDSAVELLNRTPLDNKPTIELLSNKNFYDYTIDDFSILNTNGIKKLSSNLELAI
jgi:thymidylate synthase